MEAIKNMKGRTIGFCGAGGKTTSIFFIAKELINMNRKVLITTTTKMFPVDKCKNIEVVLRETISQELLNEKHIVQWFSQINEENKGIAPDLDEIEKMNNYTDIWKLIEIDGSKHLPIKAPNESEPVYPKGLDLLLGVVGASAFGQPANPQWVHRLELFLEVTGLEENQTINPEAVACLINSPKGLFRNKPEGVSTGVLITQVEDRHKAFIEALKTLVLTPIEVMPWI